MSFDFKPENHQQVEFQPPKIPVVGRLGVLVFILFVLGIAVVFAWSPMVRSFPRAWGRYHARDAVESLKADDLGHAIAEIIAARKWAPEDPEVIRATITYLKHVEGDPRELAHQLRLLGTKETLSDEDQILYANALVSIGRAEEARDVYERLPEKAAAGTEALKLLSRLHSSQGQKTKADDVSRRALLQDKDSPESRLILAKQNRAPHLSEIRQSAWAELWALTGQTGKTGLDAARALAADSELTLDESRRLLLIVEDHPHASLLARLDVISAQIRLQPARRAEIIQDEVTRFQQLKTGSLIEMAAWLSGLGEHAHLLKLIPPNLAASSRPLYTAVVKALVGQGRWQEIQTMLKSQRPPVSNTLATLWMADAESHLQPDRVEARRLVTFAIDSASAGHEHEELQLASALAERLGMLDLALKSQLVLAEQKPPRKNEFLQQARRLARLVKETRVLLDVSRDLLELNPSNPSHADELTYLRLLLGEEMEKIDLASLKRVDVLSESQQVPRIPISLLEALAAYRFSDRDALARHLKRLPSVPDMPAGHRAVLAGMLAAAGETARAFQIAEKVPATLLLDEERSFLKLAQ